MLKLVVLAVLCTVTLAINSQWDSAWISYKHLHGKVYNPLTDNERRIIWEDNLRYIAKHNKEADNGFHSYRVAMNKFGDMTNAEFNAIMNGLRYQPKRNSTTLKFESRMSVSALPNTVDWRPKGYVTPIKNQGQCGSCWAFSATGSLEGQHFKKTGILTSLSEQNLMDCSRPEGNMACEGGLMDQAFQYIKQNNGIDTEASYPYKAEDERQCLFNRANVGASLSKYVDVPQGSEAELKRSVALVGPVSVGIDASHNSFQLYSSGVYDEPRCSTSQLDHGVLAVGYGTDNGADYWLVKNSWGTDWGMAGYIMMSRNKQNQCGIATAASFPIV